MQTIGIDVYSVLYDYSSVMHYGSKVSRLSWVRGVLSSILLFDLSGHRGEDNMDILIYYVDCLFFGSTSPRMAS